MITISQMQYICAVASHRSFSKAAEHCRISQPSLSLQIQKAETILGVPLFNRSKSPTSVTGAGKKLVAQMRRTLLEYETLLSTAGKVVSEMHTTIRLGAIPTVSPYLVPKLYRELRTHHPELGLALSELTTQEALQALDSDVLDLAILATPEDPRQYRQYEIMEESMVLYTSPKHPLLKRRSVTIEELNPEELWLLEEGHCLRDEILQFCRIKSAHVEKTHGLRFKIGNLESLRALVRAGSGYTLIPELSVESLSNSEKACVRQFTSPRIPSRRIYLTQSIYHPERASTNALLTALKSLTSL